MAHFAVGISIEDADKAAREAISSGAALAKFKEWISAQGGRAEFIDTPDLFPVAPIAREVRAISDGYVTKMNAEAIGIAAMELGAGRKKKEDCIDYTAGITLKKKYGDKVTEGDVLAVLYTSSEECIAEAESIFSRAVTVEKEEPPRAELIYGRVL
jgi:pyrimidine-nucleoside phosphorylase